MRLGNVYVWCFGLAPVLFIAGLTWLYLNGVVALIFIIGSAFFAGYLTRWIDEDVPAAYRIINIPWMGP
jgi:hypothetical protein